MISENKKPAFYNGYIALQKVPFSVAFGGLMHQVVIAVTNCESLFEEQHPFKTSSHLK